MKKITVLASGYGTNLNAILEAIENKKIISGNVSLVISSNPNAKSLNIAENYGIKTAVINRKNFNSSEEFNDAILNKLKEENPNLIVLAGFNLILSKEIISHFKNSIINTHPSLIPAFSGKGYFGLKPHEAAIKRGVKISGATVHFVNEFPDDGPIILQKCVDVFPSDSPETLQLRVLKDAEWKILPLAIELFCSNKLKLINNFVEIKDCDFYV